jgi:hypothetical protein
MSGERRGATVRSRQRSAARRSLALVKRLAAMLAVLAFGLAMPALATAQLGPTNVPDGLKAPDPSQTPGGPVDDGDDGLSTLQLVLIFGAAIVVIGAIAFVIVRDARSAAPSRRGGSSSKDGGAAGSGATKGSGKSAREREREQAAKRKKAKAARDQRKHNRPR